MPSDLIIMGEATGLPREAHDRAIRRCEEAARQRMEWRVRALLCRWVSGFEPTLVCLAGRRLGEPTLVGLAVDGDPTGTVVVRI